MKHRDINRNEITALIMDLKNAKSAAMEVEWSDKQAENLGNHLRNLELCSEIERKTGVKIIKKVVIYRGSSSCVDDIIYLNAEEFLKNTESMLIGLMSE
jgi:hypothetical protein